MEKLGSADNPEHYNRIFMYSEDDSVLTVREMAVGSAEHRIFRDQGGTGRYGFQGKDFFLYGLDEGVRVYGTVSADIIVDSRQISLGQPGKKVSLYVSGILEFLEKRGGLGCPAFLDIFFGGNEEFQEIQGAGVFFINIGDT